MAKFTVTFHDDNGGVTELESYFVCGVYSESAFGTVTISGAHDINVRVIAICALNAISEKVGGFKKALKMFKSAAQYLRMKDRQKEQ